MAGASAEREQPNQGQYSMNFVADVSPLVKNVELKFDPIVIRVNKFDEESASEFCDAMSRA